MFTYRTEEKIIGEFIKMTPFKVYIPLILNNVLLPEWSTAVCFDAPEGKNMHKEPGWKLLEFEDQGKWETSKYLL